MNSLKFLMHDLGNKLAIAQGRVSILRENNQESRDLNSLILAINRSTEILITMRAIVNSKTEKHNVTDAVSDLALFIKKLEDIHQITINQDLDSARYGVCLDVDLSKMVSVIENIVDNAAKAGATVINIFDRIAGDMLISSFSDNGRGDLNVEKIGTGYTSWGTGTGTVMIRDYMTSIGGTAEWGKSPGGGIRVVLTTPISREAMAA